MRIKQKLKHLLERAGLTPAEARFFLAAHRCPNLTIQELQKISKFSKTSAYRSFEHLKEMGFMTSSRDDWKKTVQTVSLRTVAEKLGKEKRKLGKIEMELKKMHNLMHLNPFHDIEAPVEIITDQNLIIQKSYEILHRDWEKFFCYGSAERLWDVIGKQAEEDFRKQRCRIGKAVDVIMTEKGDYAKELVPNNERELRNAKFNIDPFNQSYITYMYDDEVTIWHKDEDLGSRAIVISDPLMANMYKGMFQQMWKSV